MALWKHTGVETLFRVHGMTLMTAYPRSPMGIELSDWAAKITANPHWTTVVRVRVRSVAQRFVWNSVFLLPTRFELCSRLWWRYFTWWLLIAILLDALVSSLSRYGLSFIMAGGGWDIRDNHPYDCQGRYENGGDTTPAKRLLALLAYYKSPGQSKLTHALQDCSEW